MKTKQELNFMQRLLLHKNEIKTDLMRDFYKRMKQAPQVPAKLKNGYAPERAVSDYIDALTFGKDLQTNKKGYQVIHEYEEDGKKCKLTLEQGFLSDWEICYPATYFELEKGIYEQLLANPDEEVKGTVKELAKKYGVEVFMMTGFLDGINDSLKEANPIEEMTEDTEVSLAFDKEKLYKNMVAAKAEWLYELPQWDNIFSEEKRKELYKEQKESGGCGCHH